MDFDDLRACLEGAVGELRRALDACEELARRTALEAKRPPEDGREAVRERLLPEIERAKRRGR